VGLHLYVGMAPLRHPMPASPVRAYRALANAVLLSLQTFASGLVTSKMGQKHPPLPGEFAT